METSLFLVIVAVMMGVIITLFNERFRQSRFLEDNPFGETRPAEKALPLTAQILEHMQQHQTKISQARQNWQQISNEQPVEAATYGEISVLTETPLIGVLGIQEDKLLLVTAANTQPKLTIPLNSIRWICHQDLWSIRTGSTIPTKESLTLHCESNGMWSVYVFTSPQAEQLARELEAHTHTNYQRSFLITGPLQTSYKCQDIYGEWEDEDSTSLYLTPDRLLSLWHSWIELKQIQQLGLMPDGTLSITYVSDQLHVVILKVDFQWKELLEHATGLTMENLAGRRKKS